LVLLDVKMEKVQSVAEKTQPAVASQIVKDRNEIEKAQGVMLMGKKATSLNRVSARSYQDKLASTLVIVGMLLSACNFILPTEQPLSETLVKPTVTETEPATEAATIDETPWVTETAEPTATPTETVEPTATETAVSWSESRYYEPGFKLEMEGSVEGISVPFKVGLHPSIMNRESEPIVSVEVNRPDTADVYAKFWMTMCWKKYEEQHPEKAGISFSQYMQLVKNGGGEIEIAAVDESSENQSNRLLTFEPQKGFVYIATAEKYYLPEKITFGNEGMYFGKNKEGQLIIVYKGMFAAEVTEQKGYDGYEGWSGEDMVNVVFSSKIGEAIELVLALDIDDLLSSRNYYTLNNFSQIDRELFHDPQIWKPMVDSKNPFFVVGQ
jgi:hypothetical protein